MFYTRHYGIRRVVERCKSKAQRCGGNVIWLRYTKAIHTALHIICYIKEEYEHRETAKTPLVISLQFIFFI